MRAFHIRMIGASLLLPLSGAAAILWGSAAASAQTSERPSLPRAFGPQVGKVGSDTNLVASAANEHGSYLWIVDPIQHTVTLCVQAELAHEFKCGKQPLP